MENSNVPSYDETQSGKPNGKFSSPLDTKYKPITPQLWLTLQHLGGVSGQAGIAKDYAGQNI